ncbi:MAG: ester cyclase [Anaerolineaceae bacterium]|nr:ester cyclase [Anaerolineaceae bacterium]
MNAHANKELAQKLYRLFNEARIDEALELATEDVEVILIPFGQTFHGRKGFGEFMGGFKQAFPDLTVTVTNQVATDDQVVSECRWTGTHTGPLLAPTGEIPPTGKTVDGAVFCEVWQIQDGKLAVLRNYQDVATWL